MLIAKVNLRLGKHNYFISENVDVRVQDIVIVETPSGVEIGKVMKVIHVDKCHDYKPNLGKLLRKSTEEDFRQLEKIKEIEKNAKDIAKERIKYYNLNMELKEVKSYFDKSKIIFYFVSDTRVDFRELVKDLASALKSRIEMHQIGSRDEAKRIPGIGPCGYKLCCNTFLENFKPVTLKMARDQNLSLSPGKISGPCGRLFCCLEYEHSIYQEVRERLPKEGTYVLTEKGEGKVVEINVPKEMLIVEFENKVKAGFKLEDVKVIQKEENVQNA